MPSANPEARLSLEVTKRCNSSCIHCFAGAGQQAQTEMPVEILAKILQEGGKAGYRHLHLTGGEPLLYRPIFKVFDLALAFGYKHILLNTNGTLLDRSTCRKLSRYPELTLSVSLEARQGLHDRFRGKGAFRRVSEGLAAGLEAGLDIIVFTLACRSSLPTIPRFVDELFSRFPGLQYVTLNRLRRPQVRQPDLRNEYLTPAAFMELLRVVSLMNAIGRRVALLDEPLSNVVSRELKMPSVPESKALDDWGALMVLADLNLVPSHTRSTSWGVYTPGVIENRWTNRGYLNAMAPDESVCPECRHVHNCRANGLLRPVGLYEESRNATLFCQAVMALASNA